MVDIAPELQRTLTKMFVRMKAQTRDTAEAEAFRALKPLVTNGGTSIHMSAGGDKNFVFDQAAPAATWNITHNLGKFPSLIVQDTSGTEVEGEVTHTDVNALVIEFNSAFAGKAVLN